MIIIDHLVILSVSQWSTCSLW